MHIGFLLNRLSGGGAERVAVSVANSLASEGHSVSFVLNRKEGPYLADVAENVRILELGKRMLFAFPALVRVLRREKFDVVMTVLDQPSLATLAVKPLIGRTRVIVTECNNPLARQGSQRHIIWRFIRSLRPWLYPKADHIIAKSDGIKRALVDHFGCARESVTTIANPVDTARIARLSAEPADHAWLLDRNVPVIIMLGRLNKQKDYPTMLRAFALLRKRRPVRLMILGEGNELNSLLQLTQDLGIDEDVKMLGFMSNPYAYLTGADCFVLSSRWEGWPNSLLEALACGTPVVATDCESGPRDILDNGAYGKLVPVGDFQAMSDAIAATLDEPRDPETLKHRVDDFAPAKVAGRYAAVLEAVNS